MMQKIILLFFILYCRGFLYSQNIAVNTSGAAAASTNMFEVTQTSAAANMVAIYAINSGATAGTGYGLYSTKTGAGTTNVAGYFSATGGTNNYAGIFDQGRVGVGTTTPLWDVDVTRANASGSVIVNVKNTSAGASAGAGYLIQNDAAFWAEMTIGSSNATTTTFGMANANIANYLANVTLALGSTNNSPVIFGTNNVERMRLLNSGSLKMTGTSITSPGIWMEGTVTAAAATAYGILSRGILIAAANNDRLIPFATNLGSVNPGAFTGVNFLAAEIDGASWTKSGGTIANAYGLQVMAPTIGTSNYAAAFTGGNVGIGTTAPTKTLHVVGSGAGSHTAYLLNLTGYGLALGSTSGSAFGSIQGVNTNTGLAADLVLQYALGGNVGIGYSTPATPLHVVSSGTGTASVATFESTPGAGGMNEIILNNKTGAGNFKNNISFQASGVRKWSLGNDMSATGAQTFSIYDATVPATRLLIDANGYVGIGTASPGQKLTVTPNSAMSFLVGGLSNPVMSVGAYGSNPADGIGLFVHDITTGYIGWAGAIRTGNENCGTWGCKTMRLQVPDASGNVINALNILGVNGNVGIGTTTPSFKLHVNGGPVLGNGLNETYPTAPATAANADFLTYYFAANNWGGEGGYTNGATWFRAGAFHFWTSGVGATPTTYATILNGDFIADNGTTLKGVSDIRYKKNIEPLEKSLDKICKLRGVSYDWKDNFPDKEFYKQRQIGVIAQEVEQEFPLLVATDNQGYKSVNYMRFAPILIEAIKEQQNIIENLKSENGMLKKDLGSLHNELDELKSIVKTLQLHVGTEAKNK